MNDRTRRQCGFTLVELLVVTLLIGVVGGIVTSAIVRGSQSARVTSARTHALHEIEVALQRVGRDLRVADPIYLTAGEDYGTSIGAEIVTDGTVRIVAFNVEVGGDGVSNLVQEETIFDLADFASGTATPIQQPQRRLVTFIDNDVDDVVEPEPVFAYFDAQGNQITCTPGVDGETKASCDNDYGRAVQIRIRLVRAIEGQTPIEAETRISVRNTRYGGA